MASIPVQRDPMLPPRPAIAQEFRRLADLWKSETWYLSSMEEGFKHPAYQDIIRLGPEVVPLILRDLEENHTHWFAALETLTGADPVPESTAGNISGMAEAWLQWAKDNGYQW